MMLQYLTSAEVHHAFALTLCRSAFRGEANPKAAGRVQGNGAPRHPAPRARGEQRRAWWDESWAGVLAETRPH